MGVVEQIAAEAGVSPNTVLRVLRGQNKEVWPSAARRAAEIREIAQRLGYMPNGSARAMRTGKFNTIALLLSVDRGRSYLPNDLFNGIANALHERGMRLVVTKLADEELTNPRLMPLILREWSCDGLLVNYTDRVPAEMTQLLARHRIPSIWINRKQAADAVYYDEFKGAMAGVEHLLSLGHRRIEYVDFLARQQWDATHYSRTDRYEGYACAMRQAGLTPTPRERYAGVATVDRLRATGELLQRKDRPTALLCYDAGARVVHAAALAGVRVPEDVSAMTFGPLSSGTAGQYGEEFLGRAVTLMGSDVMKAGQKAVEMLMQKIEAPEKELAACVLPLVLDVGQTCGPVTQ